MSDARELPRLDADYIQLAAAKLQHRIEARLPGRNLIRTAENVARLVPEINARIADSKARLARTRRWCQALAAVIVLASIVALGLALKDTVLHGTDQASDWVPLVESTVNDVVFAVVAVFFVLAFPERSERRALLHELHKLRSYAHVIDMHQLDKDPEQARTDYVPTSESPPNRLDGEQLAHYFDYCSELVSLIAKAAALCGEQTSDPVVLGTVSDVETLAAQLSQKIWQKISLLPGH